MSSIQDLWTVPGPNNRRVKSDRHGHGKRWLARWEEKGSRKSKAFTIKDEAIAHLAKVDVELRAGTRDPSTTLTVGEYGEKWIRSQIHQRDSTAEQMTSRWRVHIEPELGAVKLMELTRPRVQEAVINWSKGVEAEKRGPLAPSTVAVVYGYLASLMKSAVADGLLRSTPCIKINLPPANSEKVVPLTVAQVHLVAERISPWYRGMVILGAATGLRSGELRGLTVDRLKFTDDGLRVRVDRQLISTEPEWGPPKTAKSDRTVRVGVDTAEALRRHMSAYPPHARGLVFTGREKGPVARNSMAKAWNIATADMALRERSGWHELRHHHASLLIAAGLSVTAVADRLGHQDSTETLKTYAHLWEDDEDRALQAVESRLWALHRPDGKRVETAMLKAV